jgi:hypothetical protein
MNNRQAATLAAIFGTPTPRSLRWNDIESLLRALGAVIEERAGSRVAIALAGQAAVFHRPHPRPDVGRKTVRNVRDFLEAAGVKP